MSDKLGIRILETAQCFIAFSCGFITICSKFSELNVKISHSNLTITQCVFCLIMISKFGFRIEQLVVQRPDGRVACGLPPASINELLGSIGFHQLDVSMMRLSRL